MRLPINILLITVSFIVVGCIKIDLTSQIDEYWKRITSSKAFKVTQVGIELLTSKRKFYAKGEDSLYFKILDSLKINNEKDSLFYYEYLSKFYNNLNVQLSNSFIILNANDKELKTIVSISEDDVVNIEFEEATILFEEEFVDYQLNINSKFQIRGKSNNKDLVETLLEENQLYIISVKNDSIISSKLFYQ